MVLLFVSLLAGCIPRSVIDKASDRDNDGYRAAQLGGQDCNDQDGAIHPGADEVCGDGIDNDCDGQIDDDGLGDHTWYTDADGDGHGDPDVSTTACSQPEGYVASSDDCDDANAVTYTSADEICDGKDNNRNGAIDESTVDAPTWTRDQDEDGYGAIDGATLTQCDQPSG